MKPATVQEIKKELNTLNTEALVELCLRLARFKKENKELLTYLLFNAGNEQAFVAAIKKEIDSQFGEMNQSHVYYAKKSLRKILRLINKYCRYSSLTETEVDIRIHFCAILKDSQIPVRRDKVISKLYQAQLNKIKILIGSMHEDLQYDYERLVKELEW